MCSSDLIFLHIQLFQTLGFLSSFLFFLFLWCLSPLKPSNIKIFNFRVFLALLRRWQTSAAAETTFFFWNLPPRVPEVQVALFGPKTTSWSFRSQKTAQKLRPEWKTGQKLQLGLFPGIFLNFFWVLSETLIGLSDLRLCPFRPILALFYSNKWESSPLGPQYPPLFVGEF